jgi:hypothetical protein
VLSCDKQQKIFFLYEKVGIELTQEFKSSQAHNILIFGDSGTGNFNQYRVA